jgi:hypothetical protein
VIAADPGPRRPFLVHLVQRDYPDAFVLHVALQVQHSARVVMLLPRWVVASLGVSVREFLDQIIFAAPRTHHAALVAHAGSSRDGVAHHLSQAELHRASLVGGGVLGLRRHLESGAESAAT